MLRRLIDVNINLSTIPGAKQDLVRVDTGQIEQVIINLVVNARDAMPNGGTITIETRDIATAETKGWHAPPDREEDYVMISVTDNGSGMTPETIAHIFEPFFTTKAPGHGTGLGLATSYGIVKQCGGHIEVDSEIGRGTTFRVYIPLWHGDVELPRHLETSNPRLNGTETILLVEDTEQTLFIIQTILRSYGYTVLGTQKGEDALRIAQEYDKPISLILSDVVMPNMNGMEVAKRVRSILPEAKVLLISGYTDTSPIQSPEDGKVAFLPKPFTPATLVRHVRSLLDSR